MSGIYLALAILFEVTGTSLMKLSEGFSKIQYAGGMLAFYVLSLAMLALALRRIEVGTAYAIWSGLGTALITLVGAFFFKEILSIQKTVFIVLIIIGVVGLNLSGANH